MIINRTFCWFTWHLFGLPYFSYRITIYDNYISLPKLKMKVISSCLHFQLYAKFCVNSADSQFLSAVRNQYAFSASKQIISKQRKLDGEVVITLGEELKVKHKNSWKMKTIETSNIKQFVLNGNVSKRPWHESTIISKYSHSSIKYTIPNESYTQYGLISNLAKSH